MTLGERIFIQTLAFAMAGLIGSLLILQPIMLWLGSDLHLPAPVCDPGAGEYLSFYFPVATAVLFACAPIFAAIDGRSTGQFKSALRYLVLSCAVYGSVLVYYRIAYLRLSDSGAPAGIEWPTGPIDVLTEIAPCLSIALALFVAQVCRMQRSIRNHLRIGIAWPFGA